MAEKRNRATGWQHAKLSGHENESTIERMLQNDADYRRAFLKKLGKSTATIKHIQVGGLCEKDVDCVFQGEKTKSKTDMKIILDDNTVYNVSIKKSLGGQVYLISDSRFIQGYEKQYNCVIPAEVKRAIQLFWGSAADTQQIIDRFGTQKKYENHKHRLVADSLKAYDKSLYNQLLCWFTNNVTNLVDFCFSKGLAKNPEDWANIIWYKNELGENTVDQIFSIEEIETSLAKNSTQNTEYGTRGGGTTIQLPFGFVQWHSPSKAIPGCLQFHHSYEKIAKAQKNSL